MKYEKDADDILVEENDLRTNRTLQHLRDINFYKFAVGDILIREDKYGDKWRVHTASCGLPYKYIYAFENNLGVGYIRRLSINGTRFVERPVCVVEFEPATTRFQLDATYADHILLATEGEEVDLKTEYAEAKKKREAIHRKNKKSAVRLETEAEVIAFLHSLKIGDQFWYGYSVRGIRPDPAVITSIHINVPAPASYHSPAGVQSYVEYTIAGNLNYNGYAHRMEVRNFLSQWIWLTKPIFMDQVL